MSVPCSVCVCVCVCRRDETTIIKIYYIIAADTEIGFYSSGKANAFVSADRECRRRLKTTSINRQCRNNSRAIPVWENILPYSTFSSTECSRNRFCEPQVRFGIGRSKREINNGHCRDLLVYTVMVSSARTFNRRKRIGHNVYHCVLNRPEAIIFQHYRLLLLFVYDFIENKIVSAAGFETWYQTVVQTASGLETRVKSNRVVLVGTSKFTSSHGIILRM